MLEEQMPIIQNARMASVANEHLGRIIEKHKTIILSNLINTYRSGNHDVVQYASMVASLVCLDDLQASIRKQIDAANHIERGSIENGYNSNGEGSSDQS